MNPMELPQRSKADRYSVVYAGRSGIKEGAIRIELDEKAKQIILKTDHARDHTGPAAGKYRDNQGQSQST